MVTEPTELSMHTRFHILVILCLTGLTNHAAEVKTQPELVKIAQYQREIYLNAKDRQLELDIRLAYINKALLDQLKVEGAILLDTTGMIKREKEVGIYKLKLASDSVSVVFADVIRRTGFLQIRYPGCLFVQESQAQSRFPKEFLSDQWRDAKIKPGDIIILTGL